jgi:hypothetical protein
MGQKVIFFICLIIFSSCASFNENPIYLNLNYELHQQFNYKSFSSLPIDTSSRIGTTDLNGDYKRELFLFSPKLDRVFFYTKEKEELKELYQTQTSSIKGRIQDYLSLDLDFDQSEELILAYNDRLEMCKYSLEAISCSEILRFESCSRVFINALDLELDHQLDIFLSCKRGDKSENYLYNYQEGIYKNIAVEAKIPQSFPTKYAYFADLDKDSLQDLVLLGEDASLKILRNLGNAEFKDVDFKYKPFFWGSASFLDLDNDQDLDFVVSIEPGVEAKEKWLVLVNQGNFQFENKVDPYFLHGAMSAEQVIGTDLDLNGYNDLIAGFDQYKFIEEKENSYFLRQTELKGKKIFSFETLISNPSLANSRMLLHDLENSGRPSIVGINEKNELWMLTNQLRIPYTTVKLVPSTKNLGTKIVLQTNRKKSYLYELRLKDGASSFLSSSYSFGLAPLEQPLFYTLYYAGKKEKKVDSVPLNKAILLKE